MEAIKPIVNISIHILQNKHTAMDQIYPLLNISRHTKKITGMSTGLEWGGEREKLGD